MKAQKPSGRSRTLWIVVIALGVAAVTLGLWDAFGERDGGESWMAIVVGAGIIALGVHRLR